MAMEKSLPPESGAEKDLATNNGLTVSLVSASQSSHLEVVCLLQSGADKHMAMNGGVTAHTLSSKKAILNLKSCICC